jgi:hypothetical protein
MAAVPLVMGAAMAYFLHQVYLLAMSGLSPFMLIEPAERARSWAQDRRAAGGRLPRAQGQDHSRREGGPGGGTCPTGGPVP